MTHAPLKSPSAREARWEKCLEPHTHTRALCCMHVRECVSYFLIYDHGRSPSRPLSPSALSNPVDATILQPRPTFAICFLGPNLSPLHGLFDLFIHVNTFILLSQPLFFSFLFRTSLSLLFSSPTREGDSEEEGSFW